jgi:tektin-3
MAGYVTAFNTHDQAKSYFNPARNSLYTRYAPSDWFSSNNANYNLSDVNRSQAERIRADSWQLVRNTNSLTSNRQCDTTLRLGQRAHDIAVWKSELNNEIDTMQQETANLMEHKRVLERALSDTANPYHVATDCLLHRERRRGIDMVHDGVEKNLIQEVDVIKNSQARMRDALQKTNIQLRLNRQAQHQMEKDARDKHSAHMLDDRMHQMRNSTGGIGYHPGIETVDNTVSVPGTWAKFSQQNVMRSNGERASSERLRGHIKSTLQSCANNMWSQYNNVNVAFNSRISEVTDARNKLQKHRSEVMDNIFQQERNNELLRKAIQDKEAPLKVAQTRLQARMMRPNVEACDDNPKYGLKAEVAELKDSIAHLKSQLATSERATAALNKTKATLDHDISVKMNSLNIDNSNCMGIRKGFPSSPKVAPIMKDPTGW